MLRRTLIIYSVLGLIAVAVIAGGSLKNVDTKTVWMNINSGGDTAEVTKFHDFVALDSFTYIDTIGPGSATRVAISYTSPNLVRRVTPVVDTTLTYACSVDMGTNIYGFEWLADNDITTVEALIDTLVDSINNVTGMSDSVLAQDSVSYIKLVSKFGQQRLEGSARWILVLGDSLTEGDSVPTLTIAAICDTMSSLINANGVLTDSLTAANDGDSVYTVTGDRPGWDIYTATGDTAQDTSLVVAAVTSNSVATGSFDLGRVIYADWHGTSIKGRFILKPSDSTGLGVGLSDSGYLRLYHEATYGDSTLAATDSAASLPCTLSVSIADAAGNNVVFYDKLTLSWRITDTASDTSSWPITYEIDYDYTLKE